MGELPRGTVTFLFTDIAGSARLWERAADVMPAALERHNVLIRAAVERNAGYLFKLTADGCCAAFAIAPAALAAAVDAQRALQAETWPASTPLRVRAAIHSGAAEEHDGDYFGPAVNRTARLLDAAHSGQTLLSFAARELACDTLPPDVTLRDLGMHRLRDLTRPEQIFQLVDTGLPTEFPTLRTLDAYRHNLPAQPNAIVGRGREIDNVCALLRRDDVRLVTLTGPGGVGKTRLALQLGAELAGSADGRFADGVVFVDLSPVSDTSLVASAILRALGLQEKGETPPRELLALVLRERATLLVLDNFEQVLDAAGLVRALLDAAPRLHVLVTSRAPLRLYGEREYPVSPLDLPDPQGVTPERLTQYDAVRLFIERAQAARPGFAVDNASAPTVAEICTRLDGLPLAIELAAARVRLFAPQALLARLGNRLATLTGGPRDVPARQQTLRATIAWSYDLLSVGEQVRFARLAVFVGGFDVAAAEQVCGAGIDDLDALASQSLLLIRAGADGEPRFAMLETVREYSLERLADSGHADMLRDLHTAHFLALAEQAENNLYGPAQKHWFERLAEEHDNLRAAFDHLTAQADYAGALRLGAALSYFWRVRGHYAEGRRRLDSALDRLLDASPARASALCGAGALAQENGAYADARQYYEQGARLAAQSGDRSAEATALRGLGLVAIELGDYTRSYVHFERALAICRATGDRHSIAQTMDAIGRAQSDRGELAAARAAQEEALAIYRSLDDARGTARVTNSLGQLAYIAGNYPSARGLFEQSLAICTKLGDRYLEAMLLLQLGNALADLGDLVASSASYGRSLELCRELGDRQGIGTALNNLATNAQEAGDLALAEQLANESLRVVREIGHRRLTCSVLSTLGELAIRANDVRAARAYLRENLVLIRQSDLRWHLVSAFNVSALLENASGRRLRAARLWGALAELSSTSGLQLQNYERALRDEGQAAARRMLGDAAFDAAFAQGRAMPLDRAIAYALEEIADSAIFAPAPASGTRDLPAGLSEREAEVLRLVAAGQTNAQIAETLIISPRTVNAHLNNIYAKIGLAEDESGENRRASAVRFALERGLA